MRTRASLVAISWLCVACNAGNTGQKPHQISLPPVSEAAPTPSSRANLQPLRWFPDGSRLLVGTTWLLDPELMQWEEISPPLGAYDAAISPQSRAMAWIHRKKLYLRSTSSGKTTTVSLPRWLHPPQALFGSPPLVWLDAENLYAGRTYHDAGVENPACGIYHLPTHTWQRASQCAEGSFAQVIYIDKNAQGWSVVFSTGEGHTTLTPGRWDARGFTEAAPLSEINLGAGGYANLSLHTTRPEALVQTNCNVQNPSDCAQKSMGTPPTKLYLWDLSSGEFQLLREDLSERLTFDPQRRFAAWAIPGGVCLNNLELSAEPTCLNVPEFP